MSAKTGLAREIVRARRLTEQVLGLAERGKRDEQDIRCLNLVLQALKGGHLFQASVTLRLPPRDPRLRSRRSIICIVDATTRLVKVLVNHDERMLAFPGVDWATAERRETRIEKRAGSVEEEIILRHFGRDMYSEDVIASLAAETAFGADGLEPVSPEELRDLVKITQNDPNLPTPIAGLGVSWGHPGGCRHVPYLRDGAVRRSLGLSDWFVDDWSGGWWFAARRKSKR